MPITIFAFFRTLKPVHKQTKVSHTIKQAGIYNGKSFIYI